MKEDLQFLTFLLTGHGIVIACACNTATDTIVAGLCAPIFLWTAWERMKK